MSVKRWLFWAFLLVGLSGAVAGLAEGLEGWVSFETIEPDTKAEVEALSSDRMGMESFVTVPGFYVEKVELEGETWDRIVLPDEGYLGQVGAPNLPVIRRLFAVPETSGMEVTVTNVEYEEVLDVRVNPAQPLLLETEVAADYPFEMDQAIYETDAFFPEVWASASIEGILHGIRLGEVVVHVFRYNPVKRALQVARRVDFTVQFVGEDAFAALSYETNIIPEQLEAPLKGLLLNYEYLDYEVLDTDGGVDYLVLADPKFVSSTSLKQLVNYHRNLGRTVKVVDVSKIGTTANQIKSYIQSEYNNFKPADLDYVLFVADVSVIPLKANAYSNLSSDIWYAWLEGNDMFGDVGLGRFPATSETQLKNMIDKTLAVHTQASPGAWQNRVALIAHKENYPGKYTACKESIYTHSYKNPPAFTRMYGGDSAKNWTNADLSQLINNGCGVVNYRGHGDTQIFWHWDLSSQDFGVSEVHNLNNGQKTPVVFSIACLNLNMNSPLETLGEAFVRDDQGAVAFLGSIHPSYTSPNHDFDRSLFRGGWDHGVTAIGDLLNWANADMYNTYGGGSAAKANITMYLWLGDPALRIPVYKAPVFEMQRWATRQGWYWPSQRWYTGDFNGDGKTDFAKFWDDNGAWTADVHLSTGSAFTKARWATGQGGFWTAQKWYTGDFNGDGKTDFAKFWDDAGAWTADVHLSTGSGFTMARWATRQGGFWPAQQWHTGDFNGDGKTDFAKFWNDNGTWTVDVHVATPSGFKMERWATHQGGFWAAQQWYTGDFNGDGKTDFAKFWADKIGGHWEWVSDVHVSTGTSFIMQRWATHQGWYWASQHWFAQDFNGDGKTDFAKFWAEQVSSHQEWTADVHLSTGSSFSMKRWATKQGWYWASQKWFSGDFDGNGAVDLSKFWGETIGSHEEWVADVHRSTPTGFKMERWATHQGWYWASQQWYTGDFDGDGKTDFAKFWATPVGSHEEWTVDVHLSR